MADAETSELASRLREADSEDLAELVRDHLDEIAVPEARQILLNPFVVREVLDLLCSRSSLLSVYEIRLGLAANPLTPEVRALRLIGGLYWPDLLRLGADPRVKPTLRRAADRRLIERLPGLALGEKMTIARQAGAGVLAILRHDPEPRVVRALLENPRLTEGVLMPVVVRETTPPEVLDTIAGDRRWGVRYEMRLALCRNPQTPYPTAVRLLPHLKKRDLRSVASNLRVHAGVRQRAKLLLGEPR